MMENKNMLLAIALSIAVLLGWQYFYVAPQVERQRAELAEQQAREQAASGAQTPAAGTDGTAAVPAAPTPPGTSAAPGAPAVPGATAPATPAGAVPGAPVNRAAVLAGAPRVTIDTPSISGSINLRGGRIDDVRLKKYRETVDPESPTIVLFSPAGAPDAYYADFGLVADAGANIPLPDANSVWTVESGTTLTPSSPVTIAYDNGAGLVFRRTFAIDPDYMFTVTQSVENRGETPVTLYGYGRIVRDGVPHTSGFYVLHEGPIGVFGEAGVTELSYSNVQEDGALKQPTVTSGWLGFTDKYWAATLIPEGDRTFNPAFRHDVPTTGGDRFQADYLTDGVAVAPGATASLDTRLFAGAKEVSIVDGYQDSLSIHNFELLIDWGWFYFITKPMFFLIDFFYKLVGNFGVAILLVTVLIKLAFFPLANKSYVSMSRMKLVQPQMLEIRERFKDDKVKQQQALMQLYKDQKINPLSGCLPILIQIPVFFALYKVLFVTIEMRHAPFFGWIRDLAAPDPTTIFNLFGLIPWDPPQLLMLGVWPIIMGITMFMQMKLNPTPPDPAQAMIFNWMPVIFTFMLASFPAGLVIYWAWNNTLSVLQQAFIMKRQGVKIELWDNIRGMFKKKPDPTSTSAK
jgi:YidC/Oxa1 family membrane protein insertase